MTDFPNASADIALMRASQNDKALQAVKDHKRQAEIERAAEEFEAVFIAEMLKPMFEGISTEAPFGGGKGEEIFRSMLLQEYGKEMAHNRSIGIADHVKAEMIKLQEQR